MPTKEVVLVCLGRNPQTGEPDPGAPFMVKAQDPHRSGLYYDEPAVIAQNCPASATRSGGLANAFRMRSVTSRSARAGRSSLCVTFMVSVFACRACHSFAVGYAPFGAQNPNPCAVQLHCS
jgi:hypothetical protein